MPATKKERATGANPSKKIESLIASAMKEITSSKVQMDVEMADKLLNFQDFKNLEGIQNLSAICHSFFIVKDKGQEINWKKPLL
jgi:phosphoenolpyruvate synthase/pyruvate phosphate dikinase